MGMNTDPWPFIASAYGIGFLAIYGIYATLMVQSKKLKKLKMIAEKSPS
jgi:hypothetical protein